MMNGEAVPSGMAASVWAKSPRLYGGHWLPLWRHLDDTAGVAGRLWDEWVPASVRRVVAAPFDGDEACARALLVWLASVHDIGKATPAFATQVPDLADVMIRAGLEMPGAVGTADRRVVPHATAGYLLLESWLQQMHQWRRAQVRQFAVVLGGHHGVPPTKADLQAARGRERLLGVAAGQEPWQQVHQDLLDRAACRAGIGDRLKGWATVEMPQTVQVLLTGLVIMADWIASNDELFPYDPEVLGSPTRLEDAWTDIDLPAPWRAVDEDLPVAELLASRFALPAGAVPRPIQTEAVDLARRMPGPGLMIIEAPMGEGKTETALAVAETFAARFGAGGCFVALPTRATSDAMFTRVQTWLQQVPDLDQQRGAYSMLLAHGKARFNTDYTRLFRRGHAVSVEQDAAEQWSRFADIAVHWWLNGRKKGALASFVVGTIDQLLFAALKARHLALRHLGLAGKVAIIDEVHAYDVYMSQYLDRALEWLGAYQVPTIVLSATIPAQRRIELTRAYDRGATAAHPRDCSTKSDSTSRYAHLGGDIGYPALVASTGSAPPDVVVTAPSGRHVPILLERLDDDPASLVTRLRADLADGGCALVIRNTVSRVQQTARQVREALAGDGVTVTVAHSRYLAPHRAANDRQLLDEFGSPAHLQKVGGRRPDRRVVVASQVAEQSLDIDFDLLVTDIAPIDLLLQRMGRLHRHQRGPGQDQRPPRLQQARCLVTGADWDTAPPTPVAGSIRVYDEHTLLRSAAVLLPHLDDAGKPVTLPTDIAPLVQYGYSEQPVGPDAWQPHLQAAERDHHDHQTRKRSQARQFRLRSPADGSLLGWLDAGVGEADDTTKGRAQVRDTPTESVEAIVVTRTADGQLTLPADTDGAGTPIPTEQPPPESLARAMAACTLALPLQLCSLEAIDELERRSDYPAWQTTPWLAGQLILELDNHGNTELAGYHLHYSRRDGLEVIRL